MLTDDHVPLPQPVRMSSDQAYLGYTAEQMREHARAVEREAYRRAAAECRAVAVDFRRTGNQCTDGRYDWKADSAEDCAVAVEALGSEMSRMRTAVYEAMNREAE